jgi:hypothetical protein
MYNQKLPTYGLVEKNTYLIVGTTFDLSAANSLVEETLGTYFIIPYINFKNNFDEIKTEPWRFKFNPENNDIIEHDYELSESQILDYKLLFYQISALEHISTNLDVHKNKHRGFDKDFQILILLKREQEAKEIKNGHAFSINEHPYVYEYSNALGLTIDESVDDILIRSKLMHHDLSMIEGMRLRFFKEILSSSNTQDLKKIVSNFNKECWFNK